MGKPEIVVSGDATPVLPADRLRIEMMLELIRRKESMALSGVTCEELQFDLRCCEVPL